MLDQNDLQAIAVLLEQQRKEIINQMNAIIETKVEPQIHVIAEQYTDIANKLDRLEKKAEDTDDLKGRVSTLEHVVETHTDEIRELKMAQ